MFKRSRRLLDSLIDFSLLKNRAFMNMCLGISFVFTSDFTFASFLPMMMTSRGFTKADAALAITASASAELVSRICLATFTIFVDARPKIIFFIAMICMTLAKLGESISLTNKIHCYRNHRKNAKKGINLVKDTKYVGLKYLRRS